MANLYIPFKPTEYRIIYFYHDMKGLHPGFWYSIDDECPNHIESAINEGWFWDVETR